MHLTVLRIFLTIILFQISSTAAPDSVKYKPYSLIVTPRFNTLNMAPVSGNIVNRNVNLDFSMVLTKNRFMWTLANAVDLQDRNSEMNYFLTNMRYKINLSKKFVVSPFLAFYSEHAHQLIDPISDANGGMLFTYQQKAITVEAFALFVRLTHKKSEMDIINRFEIKYKFDTMQFSAFVYQNTSYFDNKERLAVGFKLALPGFKIFKKLTARSEVTGSFKIKENPTTKNVSGVFLSLAFPLSI